MLRKVFWLPVVTERCLKAANEVDPLHAPNREPVLLTRQHEQHVADGGVIDTPTLPQSATETLVPPPLMEQLKCPLQASPHPDSDTVPAPIAVNENPDPYRQQPDVVKVIVTVLHGIEHVVTSITGGVSAWAKTYPSSVFPVGNIYEGYSKSGNSTSKLGARKVGVGVAIGVQSQPPGYVLELVPHKYTYVQLV